LKGKPNTRDGAIMT